MENWIALGKLLFLIYFIITYIEDKSVVRNSIIQVVSILLIYILLNLCKGILENKKIKVTMLFISGIICFAAGILLNANFVIFVPLSFFEIIEDRTKLGFISLACILFLSLIVKGDISRELFFSESFSFLFYELLIRSKIKIEQLSKQNDYLKEKNEELLISVQNNEEYENQVIYTSKLSERNKIAQEIHDKLGHSISGSLMQLEAAKLLIEIEPEKSRYIIQTTIDTLRFGMESIRATLKSIKPPKEQMGINKIKLLLRSFSKNSPISGRIYYEGNIDIITFTQWKVLYDNINEALTNTMKYSEARNVTVKIQVLNKLVKTEIKDDGKGCANYLRGLGITGMEERTESMNGKVIIDGTDGFSVIILLPIESNTRRDNFAH